MSPNGGRPNDSMRLPALRAAADAGRSRGTGGKRTITVEQVRFVTPNVAIADGRYELTGLSGGATRSMWATLVLTQTDSGGRITAIRNMLPATPPP